MSIFGAHWGRRAVPRVKPVISIQAEKRGALSAGDAEWSFGGAARGPGHQHNGIPMLASGRILRMSLSIVDADGESKSEAIVSLLVNGRLQPHAYVRKHKSQQVATLTLIPPVQVSENDVINFLSRTDYPRARSSIIHLLIEVDGL